MFTISLLLPFSNLITVFVLYIYFSCTFQSITIDVRCLLYKYLIAFCSYWLDEVTRYLTELDTQFIIYEEQIRAKNLLGLIVTEFDEGDYKDEFNATIRYHRLALLAYMKLCKQYGKTMG